MSQEIQLVTSSLPLQPAVGAAASVPAALPEQTPLRRMHRLLRGRYVLAAVLATVGAICGVAAGVLLPKPAWESVGIIRIDPVIPDPQNYDRVIPLYDKYLANVMIELHTDAVISQAMRDKDWRALRPYNGEVPPPEQVVQFGKDLSIKQPPGAPQMIQIIYDDNSKDGKKVAQVAVKAVIGAYRILWAEKEANSVDERIQYWSTQKTNLEQLNSEYRTEIAKLTKDVGDDVAPLVQARDQQLLADKKLLQKAQQDLAAAEEDLKRRQAGKNGTVNYTAEEIAPIDGQMLSRLNARNATRLQIQVLENKYGSNYQPLKDLQAQMQIQNRDIQDAVEAFNSRYFIEQRPDGSGGFAVPKDLAKLRSIEQTWEQECAKEDAQIKELNARHAQIVNLRDEIGRNQGKISEWQRNIDSLNFEKSMGGKFFVVDEGSVPQPANDRRPVFAAIGFLGGALLPIGLLMLIGLANPRYRFSDEAEDETAGLNLLGILPDLPDRLSDPEQASVAAHCVHQIRTMLQISGGAEERRVFAITSAAPGDGKTSLTLALGLSYAACGTRTLLIDCDLVGAGLTSRMNVSAAEGVLEAIANRSLAEYVRTTDVADVSILPVGSAQTLHASTLSPAALRRLIDEAKKQFDTILIDTGPVLGSIEASLVSAAADAVVLTVSRGQQRPLVERAIGHLMGISARLAGVVFNRAQSGDFDRSISGASSLRSVAAGNGHNGQQSPRYGTLGRAVRSNTAAPPANEG